MAQLSPTGNATRTHPCGRNYQDARHRPISHRHRSRNSNRWGDFVGRIRSQMARAIARRYSNRARELRLLLSDRYLHCDQHHSDADLFVVQAQVTQVTGEVLILRETDLNGSSTGI